MSIKKDSSEALESLKYSILNYYSKSIGVDKEPTTQADYREIALRGGFTAGLKEYMRWYMYYKVDLIESKIQENEEFMECAKRELQEETGALKFSISPICVYSVIGKNRVNKTGEETYGMLFLADIQTFENELHSEMESICFFDDLPSEWTYPQIQPLLIEEYLRRVEIK